MIFLDTSAIYAWTDRGDPQHEVAKSRLKAILADAETLVTHNYVLVEAMALIQHRLGLAVARAFAVDAAGFDIEWVDAALHSEALDRWKRGRRQWSLVDEVSFLVMRRRGIPKAFAFDPDFEREGFHVYGR